MWRIVDAVACPFSFLGLQLARRKDAPPRPACAPSGARIVTTSTIHMYFAFAHTWYGSQRFGDLPLNNLGLFWLLSVSLGFGSACADRSESEYLSCDSLLVLGGEVCIKAFWAP